MPVASPPATLPIVSNAPSARTKSRPPVGGGMPSCLQIWRASGQAISRWRGSAVVAQVALKVAALHAAIVSSIGSLSPAGSASACSPKRN